MLKVFKGPKGEQEYAAFCDEFQKASPGAQVVVLDTESSELDSLLGELAASRDLFRSGVLCRGRAVLAVTKISKKELEDSETTFAFLELELKPRGNRGSVGDGPNLFVIADKFADKDKRGLWVEYERALFAGAEPKDIYFKLQWQARCLLAARMSASAAEAGLKDYPYNKSKRALTHFVPGELERLSNSLLAAWHAGHGGGQDFEMVLESFILET